MATNEPLTRDDRDDAKAVIRVALEPLGLGHLTHWVWEEIVLPAGDINVGMDLMVTELPEHPTFKKMYPVYDELRDAGFDITAGEIKAFEDTFSTIMASAGIPAAFYDTPEERQQFLRGDVQVSLNEVQERVSMATAAAGSTLAFQKEFERLYGISQGEMTAYFLDPDKALPLIQQRYQRVGVAAGARSSGFGLLSAAEAERFRAQGFDEQSSREAFGGLAADRGLFEATQGEGEAGEIGRKTQLDAAAGNANARRRIEEKRQRRLAEFEGGAGFGVGQSGVIGLGSSQG